MGNKWDQREDQKVPGNKWKWTHNNPKPMGNNEDSPEKEVNSNTGLCKKDREISSKQLTATSTKCRGTTTIKAHSE